METRTIDGRVITRQGSDGDAEFVETVQRRVSQRGPNGESLPDYITHDYPWRFREVDQARRFHEARHRLHCNHVQPEREPTVHDELSQLPPQLAERLRASLKLGAAPVIEPPPHGELYVSKEAAGRFGMAAIEAAVERHCAGDWGVVGKASDIGELTDDMFWCRHIFSTGVQNAVAIATGVGLASSVYKGVPALPGRFDPPGVRGQPGVLCVATFHQGGGRTTLVWSGDGSGGPGEIIR